MASTPQFKMNFKWDSGMDKFLAWSAALGGNLGKASERAMKKATLMAMTEITDRIRGGKYKKLSPLTSMMKSLEGYSQTPLVRRGALIRAISREVLTPYKGVVGINKNAKGPRGRDPVTGQFTKSEVANIAYTLHEGARIKITDKMRKAFARRLKILQAKNGGASMLKKRGSKKGVLRIPPRPYIKTVFEDAAFISKVETIFWEEIYKEMGMVR